MATDHRTSLIATFVAHYDALLRYLARRTGSVDRAEDIAQDTYIRLASATPDATIVNNHSAYIYRVAANLATDAARRDMREAAWLSPAETCHHIVDPAPGQERAAIAADRLLRIEEALERLPPKARLALLMFRIDGLPHAEIARRLKVSESMVAKYIGQALRQCRNRLWILDRR